MTFVIDICLHRIFVQVFLDVLRMDPEMDDLNLTADPVHHVEHPMCLRVLRVHSIFAAP